MDDAATEPLFHGKCMNSVFELATPHLVSAAPIPQSCQPWSAEQQDNFSTRKSSNPSNVNVFVSFAFFHCWMKHEQRVVIRFSLSASELRRSR
jgi:hypothetical protein